MGIDNVNIEHFICVKYIKKIFFCRQVIEQNFVIMADVKSLKRHHAIIQNDLYKRPDGFPLSTVEEFQELESDADRLNELVYIFKFLAKQVFIINTYRNIIWKHKNN